MLSLPNVTNPMQHSISITGCTFLKSAKFKTRHNIRAPFAQDGLNRIVRLPKQYQIKRKKDDSTVISTVPKVRNYTIDKKQVSHRIKNYVNQMQGEKLLYFWTITFPVNTDDTTAHKLMNIWLTRLRAEKMIKEYLWITERQQNGTIHFHMVVNNRMAVQKANKFMRASIMHSINNGSIVWDRVQATRYNGIDIAKDRKTRRVINFALPKKQRSLIKYLSKYVTKNNTTFPKLAWHCSRGYSNLVTCVRISSSEWMQTNISTFFEPDALFENEWCIFYKWKSAPPEVFLRYLANTNRYIQSKLN